MDYKLHYINLIKTRFNRNLVDGVYYEKHHIIPVCLGGTNSPNNLIYLTPREHYIAHWLLYRIRPHSNKLSYAFWIMNWPGTNKVKREIRISSRMYQEARNAMRKTNSRRMLTNNHCIGKSLSIETKNKISESCKGKVNTLEQRLKQSKAQMKSVGQFKDGKLIEVYDSIQSATLAVKGSSSAISGVCNGNRKSHKGFQWEYIKH